MSLERAQLRLINVSVTAAVAVALLCTSLVGPRASASGLPKGKYVPYVLYAGHGIEVIASTNNLSDCSRVYISSDLRHWRNITPPLRSSPGGCLYTWASASFVSPTDGWLLANNGADVSTILRHTVNGGRTWVTEPGGETGSAGGGESIDFVNARPWVASTDRSRLQPAVCAAAHQRRGFIVDECCTSALEEQRL